MKSSRREWLQYVGALVTSVATGIGFENNAHAEGQVDGKNVGKKEKSDLTSPEVIGGQEQKETKKDYQKIIADILRETFFWVNNPEYSGAETIDGAEKINQRIQQLLKSKNPSIYIFGENHQNDFCEDFFLDILEADPGAKTVVEEALDHPDEKEHEVGLLSTTFFGREGYEEKLKELLSRRNIARVILQHPFNPAKEADSKILPFIKEGRVHILVGGAHSMLAPGEQDTKTQTSQLHLDSDDVLLKTPQQDYFFDLYKKYGAVAIKYINIYNLARECNIRILDQILPALKTGEITVEKAVQFLERQIGRYTDQLSSTDPRLVWQDEGNSGFGILTSKIEELNFDILESSNLEALFNYPPFRDLFMSGDTSFAMILNGVRVSSGDVVVDFVVYDIGNKRMVVTYNRKNPKDGVLEVDKIVNFDLTNENGKWKYKLVD